MPNDLRTTLDANLRFSVEVPGARRVDGTLTGSGSALELRVSDPSVFAGRSDVRAVRHLADVLAGRGLSVTVVAPSGPLVTLGAPRAPRWQRWVTGSRHIRIGRGAALWSLARGRAQAGKGGVLPTSDLAPPATVWPPLPTFLRRPRQVTTTHDRRGGGNPRLIMALRPDPWPGDTQEVFALRGEVTTIGSDPVCDIRLGGLEPVHAWVLRDERDEYVVVRQSLPGGTLVNGREIDRSILRTASRVQLGDWTMSFYREEFADHGRPFGGRLGGELGQNKPQPPRPSAPAIEGELP